MLVTPKEMVVGAVALGALGVMALPISAVAAAPARHLAAGLTGSGKLIRFYLDDAKDARTIGLPVGLSKDTKLVGIDFRVQDGRLYGLGNKGGIYTIKLTKSAPPVKKVSQLSLALDGTSFDIDFNPAANRLRVISNTGQNLRHNIDDPAGAPAKGVTVADATLAYPAVGADEATTGTGVTAAGYTNNDLSPDTATTVFGVDTNLNQLVLQSPANAGLLAATGRLRVDPGTPAGLDVFSDLNRGVTVSNTFWATLQVGGKAGLYRLNPLTGQAGRVGIFPATKQVIDIAVDLDK